MARSRACDHCHKSKQRCDIDTITKKCLPCINTQTECITTRLPRRQGRQPQEKCYGQGHSVRVWSLTPLEGGASASSPRVSDVSRPAPPAESTSIRDTAAVEELLRTPTTFLPPAPKTSEPFSQFKYNKVPLFDDDTPSVLRNFFSHFDVFMLGPSFVIDFRNAVKCMYTCSPVLLHDIIHELESVMIAFHRPPSFHVKQVDFETGRDAIYKLRMTKAVDVQHAFAVVGLGQVLAAFDLLTGCHGAELMLRSSLLSAESWAWELCQNELSASVLTGSILWDIVGCLFRQEIPVIRYMDGEVIVVDRMAGLCPTLLLILHDLCVVGHELKTHITKENFDTIEGTKCRLKRWEPRRPADFSINFTKDEVLKMEAQVSMYKNAGLLICHRYTHAFGESDLIAQKLATSILQCFEDASQALGAGSKLNFICFPVLLAMLELEDMPPDIWEQIALSAKASVWCERNVCLIEHVWKERRAAPSKYLHEILQDAPPFVVIP